MNMLAVGRCAPLFNSLYVLGRQCQWQFVKHKTMESDGKSYVSILNDDVEGIMVDSYSQVGFRLNNGMFILGPMAIFPRTVLSWNVVRAEDITKESLSLFSILEPKIDILILGVGDSDAKACLNKDILKYIRMQKMSVEVLPTEQACTTFNFLNAEKRYVAGVFIPPMSMRCTEDDLYNTKLTRKKLSDSDLLEF